MTLEQDEDSQYRLITKPAFEKDPWDSDYYDFIDTVDAELIPQGTTTERDNTNPYTNSLWYNTTEDRLERYDGTSWVVTRAEALQHGNEVHSEDFATSSEISSIQSSSDVDHNQTTNRTHNGDDLSPNSLSLPSGWTIVENADGEIVIEDSGSNVVFRRDEVNGEWVTDSINANTIETGLLSGNVVSRPEDIDNLEGNLYLEPEGTDPSTILQNDGDMVFIHE